jgi:endonuclease/exonuclease/phosphatase family metal-dependent hydrolase
MFVRLLRGLGILLVALLGTAVVQHLRNSGPGQAFAAGQGTLRLATLNVHYIMAREATGPWSVGDWENRKGALDAAFKAIDADVVAFQEMETFVGGDNDEVNLARTHLLTQNPGYAAAAVGDWRKFPSTQPIFYRKDRFRVADQGWFFFSETPEVIYSRTFNGSWPAFATWAEFTSLGSGEAFTVVNLHFEYKSRSNRLKSAALVRDRMEPVVAAGSPVFLLGDTNAQAGARTMDILSETGMEFARVHGSTYHFNRGLNLFGAIDHIGWANTGRPVAGPVVLRQKFAGRWPSDHYPVFADFDITRDEG